MWRRYCCRTAQEASDYVFFSATSVLDNRQQYPVRNHIMNHCDFSRLTTLDPTVLKERGEYVGILCSRD
jgi:hypothetical protein